MPIQLGGRLASRASRGNSAGPTGRALGYCYRLLQLPAQLGKGIYALSRVDAGNVWADEFDAEDLRYGGAVGLGADLAIGPLYVGYGRADEGYDCFYFSLGTVF
jgi:NTE family protein